ncbi:hypothetical protein C0J29_21310 [Mycobacterium paragordonae]|uniref:Uncharacterized protein n=1 Tax=Mycobacterium paragordonae TaxID=1389713 RepID=A0ABQ1C7W1_9MYCO|nr:hypothetical protein C0J29_21310 [Mycobacterium paragordonae]GFG80520.1 hypothetical protein MPRG_37960 [Mycobacterium paragordonae]
MADGETPSDSSGAPGQSDPAGQRPAPAAAPAPPGVAVAAGTEKTTWKTLFAALPGHLASGLTHLSRWLSHLGGWLAGLGRRLARLSEIKPTPLQKLALLSGFAALSIFGALAFPANPIGQACVIAFVPGLCIAIGIFGTRWYAGQKIDQHLWKTMQNAVHTTQQLRRSLQYVDDRLSAARTHLDSGSDDGVLIEVVRAKTATEISVGVTESASQQWGRTLPAGAVDLSRPISGSVARVEDQHTLIINRGSAHGAEPDMVFAVLANAGEPIVDPETGEVIGELPTEKLRVKVVEVQPKYSRAVTFRTFAPEQVQYPALTSSARAGSDVGALDFIDESISRMLEAELAEPAREKIANARSAVHSGVPARPQANIDIGDRVQQVG